MTQSLQEHEELAPLARAADSSLGELLSDSADHSVISQLVGVWVSSAVPVAAFQSSI